MASLRFVGQKQRGAQEAPSVRLHWLCGCPFDPHVVYGQLCCCCCCCGGHFAVLPCLSSSHRPIVVHSRSSHSQDLYHHPPAIIADTQPPRSRSCGGQGVDGRWQMPLTMAQFCMQLTFTARCFLLSECVGPKGGGLSQCGWDSLIVMPMPLVWSEAKGVRFLITFSGTYHIHYLYHRRELFHLSLYY